MGRKEEAILTATYTEMVKDPDVGEFAGSVADGMGRLLSVCDVEESDGERDGYTSNLVGKFVVFVLCPSVGLGGSLADYCASNAHRATRGYRLRLMDNAEANEILHEMRVGFHAYALEPRRMFGEASSAGIPIGRH